MTDIERLQIKFEMLKEELETIECSGWVLDLIKAEIAKIRTEIIDAEATKGIKS